MTEQFPRERNPLLPDRMQQADFFVCDIFDAAPKGDMASMEHPIFSISTRRDMTRRHYENGNHYVEIRPSDKGLATVHDRDILIFCVSQVMAALNNGEKVGKRLRFKAYDLLSATNRPTGGESYLRLKDALERLSGTRIQTNITTGGHEVLDDFGLIDRFQIVRESREGRMLEIEVELSEWVFNAIEGKEVLTISRDYFRLRKPLERRIYDIARKHCGTKASWKIGLDKLQYKCGSQSKKKEFKRLINKIIEENTVHDHFPDYELEIAGDFVVFYSRGTTPQPISEVEVNLPPLSSDTLDEAKSKAPGWDVYFLEQQWRSWCQKEAIEPKMPQRHFLSFCSTWAQNHQT